MVAGCCLHLEGRLALMLPPPFQPAATHMHAYPTPLVCPGQAGTSSTWSLSRLDGLAAEALSHFEAALAEGSLPQEGFSLPGSEGRPSQPEGPASTPEQQPADQGPIQDSGPACSASAAGSSEPLSSNSSSSAGSGSGSGGSNGASSPTGASLRPGLLQQVRRFPFLALASLNAVLYDRHGYKACNRYGEPR